MAKSSSNNKVLKTNSGDVTLGSLLGEGATAYVYRATMNNNNVVVKMAKIDENDFVDDEWKVLEKAQKEYGKKGQVSPVVYEHGQFENHSYIVMEYLGGMPALDILLQDKGKLSEEQTLSVAVEFFHFMDFLHSKCELTYPDLKFDNVRLEEDGDVLRLRLFDFGGLKRVNDGTARPERDIIVVSSMIFALLKGFTLQLLGGEITEDIEQKVKINSDDRSFNDPVSWGTRYFLGHLLSRNPEIRINSAQKAEGMAKELLNLWTLKEAPLFELITGYLAQAKQENLGNLEARNENLTKARMGFEIYKRKFPTAESVTLAVQVEKLYEGTSYLENGKIDLKHGLYDPAIRKFRAGETLESNFTVFRRWRYLAQALVQGKDDLKFEDAENIVNLFKDEKYQEILKQVDLFPPTVDKDLIKIEAEIYSAYKAGFAFKESGQYQDAVREFEKMQGKLSSLSEEDQKSIKKDGDPKKLIDECLSLEVERKQQDQYKVLGEELKGKFSNGEFPHKDIRRFIVLGQYETGISEQVEQLLSNALLGQGDITSVFRAASTLFWGIPEKTDPIRDFYHICRDLANMQQYIEEEREDDEEALSLFKKLVNKAKINPAIMRRVGGLLSSMVNSGYSSGNFEFWKDLQILFPKKPQLTDSSGAEAEKLAELVNKQIERIQKIQTLAKTVTLKQVDEPLNSGELHERRLMLFAMSFSKFDGKSLSAGMENQKKLIGAIVKQVNVNGPSVGEIENRWGNIAGVKFDGSQTLKNKELFDLVIDSLNYVWYAESEKEPVLEIVSKCFEKIAGMRLTGWRALGGYLLKDTERLDKANEDFEKGDLIGTLNIIKALPVSTLILYDELLLCERIVTTQAFEKWVVNNKHFFSLISDPKHSENLEKEIENHINMGVPRSYLNKGEVKQFLDKRNRADLYSTGLSRKVEKKKSSMQPLVFSGAAVVILLTVVGVFMLLKSFVPTVVASTSTPVPISTNTPTQTVLSPTPTTAFTPTFTPTPFSKSSFLVSDTYLTDSNLPELPFKALNIWQLPAFTPCGDVPSKYCGDMDVPVDAGNYALLLFNDLKTYKRTTPIIKFEVSLQGADQSGLEGLNPVIGISSVQPGTFTELNSLPAPLPKVWIWAGNYNLTQPGKILVRASLSDPTNTTMAKAFEKIILVKLDDSQWAMLPSLDGYNLVSILDDTNLNQATLKLVPTSTPQANVTVVPSGFWNGGMTFVKTGIFVGSGVMQPGTYKAFYHTAEGIVSGNMNLRIQAGAGLVIYKELEKFLVPSKDQWLEFEGNFTLDKSAQLTFIINSADSSPVLVDAILIYMKTK